MNASTGLNPEIREVNDARPAHRGRPASDDGAGESLRSEGYAVDVAGTAEDGRWMATEVPYDTIVLDVGLPDGDGIDLCAALRDGGVWAPILVLTAHAEIRDRVRGLDSGADDYLAKPFSFDELIARVRALLRRGQVERPSILTVGSMRLDPATRRVSVDRAATAHHRACLRHPRAAGSPQGSTGDPRGDHGARLGLGLGRRVERHRCPCLGTPSHAARGTGCSGHRDRARRRVPPACPG